jgi:hypothetical protein
MSLKSGLTLTDARREAKVILGSVAKGADPLRERRKAGLAGKNTLKAICEEYLMREGGRLRTVSDRRTTLERLVYPVLGTRQIEEIKRSDINRLLDRIEDESGARTASLTLAYLRKILNWHQTRDDDFVSPIVRGMDRGSATKRDRVLADDELRAVWKAADEHKTPFARMLQFILLTGVRRNEARQRLADCRGAGQERPRHACAAQREGHGSVGRPARSRNCKQPSRVHA